MQESAIYLLWFFLDMDSPLYLSVIGEDITCRNIKPPHPEGSLCCIRSIPPLIYLDERDDTPVTAVKTLVNIQNALVAAVPEL